MKCWKPLSLLIALVCPLVWAGSDAHNLLVTTGDSKLLLVHPDGVQELISEEAPDAALSPDGQSLAYVVWHMREQPKGVWGCDCKLMVMNLSTHATKEIVHLPPEASFGEVGWSPDGSAIAYEFVVREKGKGKNDLILAPFPPERGPARNLGPWYQGFSFSPDSTRIVHAVNSPYGLEVLDIATRNRTLLHKASNVVWDAKFSPNGKFIAYRQTIEEPKTSQEDDGPDCAAPNTALHIYSVAGGSDSLVTLPNVKAPPSVYHFAWSPDSRRIALELGTEDCDYPGDDAAVFVANLDQKSGLAISNASPAIQPVFSSDGSAVAFVDSSHFPNRLLRYDFANGSRNLIRQAEASDNSYRLLGWK
jgi:Tol biopolymer transport system component